MEDCLFCKIVAGEIPSHKIYEDKNSFVFLDIHPQSLGHAMVIPKIHAVDITELPQDKVGPLFETVQKMAKYIPETLGAAGLTVGINQGTVSGQVVPHLHVHLMPRFEGDGGGSVHSAVNNPPTEDVAKTADRLKKNI